MRTSRTIALTALLVVGLLAVVVPAASASEKYTARVEACGARGSGNADLSNTLYAACGTRIVRIDASGKRLADITHGSSYLYAVAPSPDGKYLYIGVSNTLRRMDRQTNGTYKLSTTWKAGRFALAGTTFPITPRTIRTDDFGYLYISVNGTNPETNKLNEARILKVDPTGKVVTSFGEHNNEPGNPYAFYQNRGVGVSRDGRMIFVTSHLQGQVRRFDLQPDGSYAPRNRFENPAGEDTVPTLTED